MSPAMEVAQQGGMDLVPPQQVGGQMMSLSVLIDMLVQRTYHDLTILAELLPRKTDMERKIEIFNFASRTRMMFVRLLALVKWASSAGKVEKCANIVMFLEKQSSMFLDTANQMAGMARETLVRATLPNFHLPAAAEILTTGTYSRLPRCIKERIIPPAPITPVERRTTLLRLNQVIENRLVSSNIPMQMRNLVVEDGTVTFTVKLEFSCKLTVLGDSDSMPWTLLDVTMLVEDRETGQGKALLHSLQVGYLLGLAQSRLLDSAAPLQDLYSVLHSLAQLLQLEVLYTQVARLAQDRLGSYIRVEEYILGRALTISYWRELACKDPTQDAGWRLSVQVDPHDSARPLMVVHTPALTVKEAELAERSIRTERLSVESLLVHTIYVRTRARLTELKASVQQRLKLGGVEATLYGSPAVLCIPILQPCLRSEQLLVSVDTHTGNFLAHVPQYLSNPFSAQIQACLNSDQSQLETLVTELRYWITARRIEKTLQQLPATPFEQLPLLYDLKTHQLSKLGRHKMFIKLHKQPSAVLVVEFAEKPERECEIQYSFYYLLTKPCSIEDDPVDESIVKEIPRVYMKALGMVEFDPFLVTHGSTTKVDVQELSEKIIGKRKPGGKVEAPIKRTKFPAYFISDLAHVVAFADERIPFTSLEQEMARQGVSHTGTTVETNGVGLSIKIVQFPNVPGLSQKEEKVFAGRLLSATVRLSRNPLSQWVVEWMLCGSPIMSTQSMGKPLYSQFKLENLSDCEKTVSALVGEWNSMAHLHSLVREYARYSRVVELVTIQSYNYRSIVLEYGPSQCYTATITWNVNSSSFCLTFGGTDGMNPHCIMKSQLEIHLNKERSLALLGKILHETYGPVRSLCRLPNTPHKYMSSTPQQRNTAIQTFTILPQSPTHVKVMFYNIHCVDVHFRADGLVSIRDGSFSMFDQTKVLTDLEPIRGFKAFLYKYVDEAALARRTSQTEDDNPPSPLTMDQDQTGLKFAPPITPPSNPLTPVSPHGQQPFLQSPPTHRQPSASPAPSPGVFPIPSPIQAGSPFTAASPLGGSPRPRPSPRHPGSSPNPSAIFPSSSHQTPSRILPQRLWAAAIPTPLTTKAFDELCRPSSLAGSSSSGLVSPMHRFLGCVFMRRQLQHIIKNEEFLSSVETREPSVIAFKVESGLQCKVSINPDNSFQSLHLKVAPDDPSQWQSDQLLIIQKFFDAKVVAPPYRPTFLSGFCRLLHCPQETLKNIVQLMRYEVMPELVVQGNLKWAVSLCLTIPSVAPNLFPVGQAGIIGNKDKILIFMQLTRANVQLPPGQEPLSVVVPVIYNINQNQTILASLQKELNNPSLHAVQNHLQNWARANPPTPATMGRCSILPAIHDLLMNLTLPNEGPPYTGQSM